MSKPFSNTIAAFLALLQAGLWEKSVRLGPYMPLDFDSLYSLAEEQSVVGLIAAGLEQVEDMKITKQQALPFMKKVFAIESRNADMNLSVSRIIGLLADEHIIAVLVKGQGIAQCYARPQWRSAGDIDLLLDYNSYVKAEGILSAFAQNVHPERKTKMHIGMTIDSVEIELHGTLHSGLSRRLDTVVDSTQDIMIQEGLFRKWGNNNTIILLPSPDNDVIFIFSHILQHFYKGGIGLRQICDWCRLLWTYSADIDRDLLDNRLREMGVKGEWDAFATMAIEYLGLPLVVTPLFGEIKSKSARKILDIIIESGNFGRNRDISYQQKELPIIIRKAITLMRQIIENCRIFRIFPKNAILFLFGYIHSQLED